MKFQLDSLVEELDSINEELLDPSIYGDQKRLKELSLRKKNLEAPVDLYKEYKACYETIEEAKLMLNDPEMGELAKEEKAEAEKRIPQLEEDLKIALIPQDPNDDKNIIIEVRAGTGGEEAALFASELGKAYINYAQERGFKIEIMDQNFSESGGVREFVFKVVGEGAYSVFKFEGGAHRVQRIPATESKGRVHTSAVTVAVLPEVDDIEIDIKADDLEISFCRSSGAGGQHVNTTDSAVRIVHKPTGIVAESQDGRSQHSNKDKAMQVLKARIYAAEEEKRAKELGAERLSQVGSGDRSEKIRTYNFPQDRVTDHRIGQNFSGIPQIMGGRLAPIIEALQIEDQKQKLENASN